MREIESREEANILKALERTNGKIYGAKAAMAARRTRFAESKSELCAPNYKLEVTTAKPCENGIALPG